MGHVHGHVSTEVVPNHQLTADQREKGNIKVRYCKVCGVFELPAGKRSAFRRHSSRDKKEHAPKTFSREKEVPAGGCHIHDGVVLTDTKYYLYREYSVRSPLVGYSPIYGCIRSSLSQRPPPHPSTTRTGFQTTSTRQMCSWQQPNQQIVTPRPTPTRPADPSVYQTWSYPFRIPPFLCAHISNLCAKPSPSIAHLASLLIAVLP